MNFLAEMLVPNVWPLCFLLVALFVLRQVHDDVRPIFNGMVAGLSKNAQSNAQAYAIAMGFGLSASFSAFWDVFHSLNEDEFRVMSWHQYFALWTKVANPFIVAVLAYATQNRFVKQGTTNPPFPTNQT